MNADALSTDVPEPSHTSDEWTVVHGWVQPHDGRAISLAALTVWLRGRAIASVSAHAPAPGESATVGLVVTVPASGDDAEALVAGQGPAGPDARLPLQDLAEMLAVEFDASVSIGDVWADSREDDEDAAEDVTDIEAAFEDSDAGEITADDAAGDVGDVGDVGDGSWLLEHPLVIASRVPESTLPLLARDLDAELTAVHVDGFTVALAKADYVFLDQHGWLRSELPAVAVGRSAERRYVAVIATPSQDEELGLVRYDDLIPVLDPIGLEPGLVAALTVPHLAPGSAVRRLCATRPYAHVAPRDLATVLQSPMDDRWSSRVLAVLGFPLEVAEIAEERTTLDKDAVVIEPRGFWAASGEMLARYYDAPAHEVATRSRYGQAYAAVASRPATVAATVAVESVAAVMAWRAAGRASGWKAGLLRTLAVSLVSDVAGHAVLAPRKFLLR